MNPNSLPVRLVSSVVPGFGRGSKDLGIPTVQNIKIDELLCGTNWEFARIVQTNKDGKDNQLPLSATLKNNVYKTAISIGFNSVCKSEEKTIEPHLIASDDDPLRKSSKCQETQLQDLYGHDIRLSIVAHLRPELPFEGLDKLIEAIKNDIVQTEKLASSNTVILLP